MRSRSGSALLAWLVDNDYYLRILFMMGVYYLCAAGMNVLVGYAGQKSLGQAGLFAAGAYAAALLTTSFDLDPWAALVAAAVVAGLCGVLIAWPSLRVRGPYLAMVTLAFGIVVEKLVSEWTEVFGGAEGIFGIKPLTIAGTPFSSLHWVWFAIALGAATHLLLRNLLCGRFGRAFLSLQADEIAAESVGVSVYRYKILAFVIAAVTCGIAGAMVAQQNQYVNSDFITFHLSIFILLLVLFGGSGNLYGPLIGAVLLTLIDALLARWPSVQHFAYGALLLFALYLMPNGVAGLLKQLFGAVARKHETLPEPKALKPAAVAASIDASQPLLDVDHVSKNFGGVRPAQDVSFRLTPGHVHALIGPNGAGKSTMINMITGVLTPTSGRIAFIGQDIGGTESHVICRMGIGRTFQNLRLFANLSVLENVLLGQHCRMKNGFWASLLALPSSRREEAEAHRRASAILGTVGPCGSGTFASRQPAIWPAAPGGTRSRARNRAEASAPRRAGGRPQSAGDGGTRQAHRQDQQTRDHDPDGRASHGSGDVDLRSRHRTRLRNQDRGRPARGNPVRQASHRGLSRRRSSLGSKRC